MPGTYTGHGGQYAIIEYGRYINWWNWWMGFNWFTPFDVYQLSIFQFISIQTLILQQMDQIGT